MRPKSGPNTGPIIRSKLWLQGEVDGRVGLLLMFGVVSQAPTILDAVQNGKTIKLQKGDFSAEVSASDE